MVLIWDNLTLNYRCYGRRTIHGVSGHVRRGECHLVTSDQDPLVGCLLHALAEWRAPSQEQRGSITWDGHERRPHEWYSRIGVVSCDEPLEAKLTVRECLWRSVRLRRWDTASRREKGRLVQEALELFELESVADKFVESILCGPPQASPLEKKLLLAGSPRRPSLGP